MQTFGTLGLVLLGPLLVVLTLLVLGPLNTSSGGVRLRLGDHFYADELRALGLPKRAFITQSSANVEMTFGDARDLT